MQKFTRALTREIEIEGERLALTMDAGGVSLRPVGSRRPPLTLPWSAVLCANPSPNSVAIATALEELRGNVRPTASAAHARPSGDGIPEQLARLDAWLAKHRRRFHEGLLPGATPEEIGGLSQVIGRPVPVELQLWLQWHNGQDEELIGAFYTTFNLMSAAQIAAAWQERALEAGPGWRKEWLPLLDDYQGDLIVLDASRPGCPLREVWRGRNEHEEVAPSLVDWLEDFVAAVEKGSYEEDPERGEFHPVES